MPETRMPARLTPASRALAGVPPELERFQHARNARTRAAYTHDAKDFMDFIGIARPEDFRLITRAHVIAWRGDGTQVGITVDVHGFCVHSLRAMAATNALAHNADLAKVQEWLGHANIPTTRISDKRRMRPEGSPTFKVAC